MSLTTEPIRVTVEPLPLGGWRVSIVCNCAHVGRHVSVYESLDGAVEELRAEHHRRAGVYCRHPWVRS